MFKGLSMRCFMGVDIGTGGCKAAVFDEDGRQLGYSYREYDVICPQAGWVELDSDEVIERCFEVISESAKQAGGFVAGLGISSQGEAFTPVDADGKVLCNALVSSDCRADKYAQFWAKDFGVKKLYEITGHTPHPMFSLFKLLWILDNRKDIAEKADKYLCFEDLLQLRLGLKPAMGYPMAGRTMLFDIRKRCWSKDILDAVGLSEDKFATPMPSGTKAGVISGRAAAKLGLGKDVFVVTGGHDQPCSALGAGSAAPGTAVYATGTVECLTAALPEPIFSSRLMDSNLCTYHHTAADMYATVAFSLTGGNLLRWFRDQFGAMEIMQAAQSGRSAYELLIEQMPQEPTDIMVLPYFTPTGTPYFDTSVKGLIYGLTLASTRGQIIRGLLEGVAMEMKLNLEILDNCGYKINELRAIGGGAKSVKWVQLKADVLNRVITVLDVKEAGCMGAAILAAAADAGAASSAVAQKWVKPVTVVYPQEKNAAHYEKQFQKYRSLYPIVKDW